MHNPQGIKFADLRGRRVKLTRTGKRTCKGFLKWASIVQARASFSIVGAEEQYGTTWVRCDDIELSASTRDMVVTPRSDCIAIEGTGFYMEVYQQDRWSQQ